MWNSVSTASLAKPKEPCKKHGGTSMDSKFSYQFRYFRPSISSTQSTRSSLLDAPPKAVVKIDLSGPETRKLGRFLNPPGSARAVMR